MNSLFRLTLVATVLFIGFATEGRAQQGGRWAPPRNTDLRQLRDVTIDGSLEGVQGNLLQVKITLGHPYLVALQPNFSKLGISGTAKPDYLKPGMFVSFTADLPKDKKVELEQPLTDLAIISPSETNTPGLFNEDRDNKDSTKFFVRGTVRSFKEGKLTVSAGGKQITADVPADAMIKVESIDLSIVRQGDGIKVTGKEYQQYRSQGNQIMPGKVIGQQVDITLQEVLTADTFKKKSGKQ